MGCETNCANEHRFKKLEENLQELKGKNSQDHKEFYSRIESVEKENAVAENDSEHLQKMVENIDQNVKSLMEKPADRYEKIMVCVITGIISLILGFLASGILPM